ncbi:MAG TPA: glycosyltransferase [bacterium]|nr:glycosyltransferase [bacterium]
MKVALVHDYLNQWGGAEEVLLAFHELFPDAPIYTLFYDEKLPLGEKTDEQQDQGGTLPITDIPRELVRPSGLQKLPKWLRNSRLLMPVYPTSIEMLDLSAYDLIVSDSSSYAKGVITRPDTVHICYLHTPTRYLWDYHERYLAEQKIGWFKKTLIVPMLSFLRVWDCWAADRVDFFIANSENVRDRIRKYYNRDATVIYPPIDVQGRKEEVARQLICRETKEIYDGTESFDNYYLFVGRLSAYKRVDLAIEACNRLQLPLMVVNTGREEEALREQAWSTVRFAGHVTREELADIYRHCKALIMPGLEDFGMVMVEAMSYGKPVIAFEGGGALEIVKPGMNGEFFRKETPRSLMDTIRIFEQKWQNGAYLPVEIHSSVERFDRSEFVKQIRSFIEKHTTISK